MPSHACNVFALGPRFRGDDGGNDGDDGENVDVDGGNVEDDGTLRRPCAGRDPGAARVSVRAGSSGWQVAALEMFV